MGSLPSSTEARSTGRTRKHRSNWEIKRWRAFQVFNVGFGQGEDSDSKTFPTNENQLYKYRLSHPYPSLKKAWHGELWRKKKSTDFQFSALWSDDVHQRSSQNTQPLWVGNISNVFFLFLKSQGQKILFDFFFFVRSENLPRRSQCRFPTQEPQVTFWLVKQKHCINREHLMCVIQIKQYMLT